MRVAVYVIPAWPHELPTRVSKDPEEVKKSVDVVSV